LDNNNSAAELGKAQVHWTWLIFADAESEAQFRFRTSSFAGAESEHLFRVPLPGWVTCWLVSMPLAATSQCRARELIQKYQPTGHISACLRSNCHTNEGSDLIRSWRSHEEGAEPLIISIQVLDFAFNLILCVVKRSESGLVDLALGKLVSLAIDD
jgi:hypothetical protein